MPTVTKIVIVAWEKRLKKLKLMSNYKAKLKDCSIGTVVSYSRAHKESPMYGTIIANKLKDSEFVVVEWEDGGISKVNKEGLVDIPLVESTVYFTIASQDNACNEKFEEFLKSKTVTALFKENGFVIQKIQLNDTY